MELYIPSIASLLLGFHSDQNTIFVMGVPEDKLPFSSKIKRRTSIITAKSMSLSILYYIIWQHDNNSRGINNGMLIPSGNVVSVL